MRRKCWPFLLVVWSACSSTGFPGDALCAADGGCPSGQACARVTSVLTADGRCLASTGASVCRPVCASCPGPGEACGCVCPP